MTHINLSNLGKKLNKNNVHNQQLKMKAISNAGYQKIRNKIWNELISAGVASDEDENY